mgnify:CR=1 FL=1|tara:strand:- start:664 stop:966 length:303 start_codon:yes stop_codon:yes gene_type:complete
MSTLLEEYEGDVIISWVEAGFNQMDVRYYEVVVRIEGPYKYVPILQRTYMEEQEIPEFNPIKLELRYDYENEKWYIEQGFEIPDEFSIRKLESDETKMKL